MGFVLPRVLAGRTLHYSLDRDAGGARRNYSLDLDTVESWEPVAFVTT
jgi:hypothetical protein